jgi:hypothetical protein
VIIASRFRGPADSGNGGYSCGTFASLVDGAAEVTLRLPPPLDREFAVERADEGARVSIDGKLVAEVKPATVTIEPPPAPSLAEAADATRRFIWFETHPCPSCFVCGPKAGDGLGIFPGAVEGRAVAAAPFQPDASLADESGRVRPEIVWAALDCPSWFGFHCFDERFDGLVLLGRLAARIDERPRAGDRCVCAGWLVKRDGRKIHCGSAIYRDGVPLAVAQATWIVLREARVTD